MKKSAIIVCGLLASVSTLFGCATGSGGGLDHVAAQFDSGAKARVAMREAAERKFAPAATLIAAHNKGQDGIADKTAQRRLVEWWRGENSDIAVEAMNGEKMSEIYSVWKAQAKNRPTNSEQLVLWEEDMQHRKELFLAQADILESVATHFETNPPQEMTAEDVSSGIALFRQRASAIRAKEIRLEEPVTASLEIGNNATVTAKAAQKEEPAITKSDVNGASNAAKAYGRGDTIGAARKASTVVFNK